MAINPERKKQLDAFIEQMRGQQQGGQQGRTTMDVLRQLGPPFTSGVISKAAGTALEPTPKEAAETAALQKRETGQAETLGQLEKGSVVSKINLQLVSQAARDFAQVYADAVKEGGAGGALQAFTSERAEQVGDLPEWLGGATIGGRFPASGALEGKTVEFLTKLMPSLTQQPTRPEGSVRLITTIFEAFKKTIPEKRTSIFTGRRQLKETLLSFTRFARVAQLAGKDFNKVFNENEQALILEPEQMKINPKTGKEEIVPLDKQVDSKLKDWVKDIQEISSRIEFSDEEQAIFDEFVATSLTPIDEAIAEKEQPQQGTQGLTPEEQIEFEELKREFGE